MAGAAKNIRIALVVLAGIGVGAWWYAERNAVNEAARINNEAVVRLDNNDPAGALKLLDGLANSKRATASTHVNRGIALMELKRFDEARSSIDRALAMDPANARAKEALAELAVRRNAK